MPGRSPKQGTTGPAAVKACRSDLRSIAADLRAVLDGALRPDEQAYAALVRGSEVHPCTEEAEAIWASATGSDEWRAHHLAILHHAMAYDLEIAERPDAVRHWSAALEHWATVIRHDRFWARLERELIEHTGHEDDRPAVIRIRASLARELLEPHRDIIAMKHGTDVRRAQFHMDILKASPFGDEPVDDIRTSLVRDVLAGVPEAVKTARFDRSIPALRHWLEIDGDNSHLLQAWLYVFRQENEQLWNADGGFARIVTNVTEADRLVRPVLDSLGAPSVPERSAVAAFVERIEALRPAGRTDGALAAEVARHEYWRGVGEKHLAEQRFSWSADAEAVDECERQVSDAVAHLGLARLIDPEMTADFYYRDVKEIEAMAESLWGMCRLASSQHGRPDVATAAQHFRRAIALVPTEIQHHVGLARALTSLGNSSVESLVEADAAAAEASRLAELSGDADDRAAVSDLQAILAIQGVVARGDPGRELEQLLWLRRVIGQGD